MNAMHGFNRWLRAIFRSGQTRQRAEELWQRVDSLQRELADGTQRRDAQFVDIRQDLAGVDALRRDLVDSAQQRDVQIADIRQNLVANKKAVERIDAASCAELARRNSVDETIEMSIAASQRDIATMLEATARLANRHAELLHRVDRAAPEFPQASDVGAWSALTFANAFRGSFEDIQARLAVYLPDVSRAMRRTRNTAVIDIGCGRGEWLELLRGNGFNALGIDESPDAVKTCAERGLDARVGDAIESLRAQPDASVAAVTAFHVVEHIPYANVVALIVEAFRVVCPGGILIIETPNCENVVVGANGFWLDPTHIRPYPLPLLEFLVMQAGFVPVELKRLHPDQALLDDPQMRAVPEPLRAAVAGPQDGGIVAMRKAT